jgi:hypothetical protein
MRRGDLSEFVGVETGFSDNFHAIFIYGNLKINLIQTIQTLRLPRHVSGYFKMKTTNNRLFTQRVMETETI